MQGYLAAIWLLKVHPDRNRNPDRNLNPSPNRNRNPNRNGNPNPNHNHNRNPNPNPNPKPSPTPNQADHRAHATRHLPHDHPLGRPRQPRARHDGRDG